MTDAERQQQEKILDALRQAQRALRPFAERVFYDNGDCTISDTHRLTASDFISARSASLKIADAIEQALAE